MERNLTTIDRVEVEAVIRSRMNLKDMAKLLYPEATDKQSAANAFRYWLKKGTMPTKMYQRMTEIIESTPTRYVTPPKACYRSSNKDDRNEQIYQRWVNGEGFESIAKENGITRERVRQICETIGRRKNSVAWLWMSRFGNRMVAILIKNNIHCESELHEWWGDGKELKGVSLKSINENLETPLVYVKKEKPHYRLIDLTGKKFGRLTVIKKAEIRKHSGAYWVCQCECGNTTEVASAYLRDGRIRSCGCLADEYRRSLNGHGVKNTKLVRCFRCKHHTDGNCEIWKQATEEYGFCHKGEPSDEI